MSHTYANLLVHCVFGTKDRQSVIQAEIEPLLYSYIGGICRGKRSNLIAAGGTTDHVHLLIDLGRTTSVADLVQAVKGGSSAWIKSQGAMYRSFQWQIGYGAFTIGQSQADSLKRYIANQKIHHTKRSFREEFAEFVRRYGMELREDGSVAGKAGENN